MNVGKKLEFVTMSIGSSVACAIIGLGHKAGADPVKYGAFLEDNKPKRFDGKAVDTDTQLREAGESEMYVSSVSEKTRANDKMDVSYQDGGNGSGGDASQGIYKMDMLRGSLGVSFWKQDKLDPNKVPDTIPQQTSVEVARAYNAGQAPELARVFGSHAHAMEYMSNNREALENLFNAVLLVGVAVHEQINRPK